VNNLDTEDESASWSLSYQFDQDDEPIDLELAAPLLKKQRNNSLKWYEVDANLLQLMNDSATK
jgi:hypothetical protein